MLWIMPKQLSMVQEKGRLFETYNIGGHNEKQNIEIVEIIIETLQEQLADNDPRKAFGIKGFNYVCRGQKRA